MTSHHFLQTNASELCKILSLSGLVVELLFYGFIEFYDVKGKVYIKYIRIISGTKFLVGGTLPRVSLMGGT